MPRRRRAVHLHNDKIAPLDRGDEAYQKIRLQILDADLAPGTLLSEYQLARDLGLSRTPIREALTHLERDGLVRAIRGRGTLVTEMSLHDILEIYEVRGILETFAARIAAEQLADDEIHSLAAEIHVARKAAAADHFEEAFRLDVHLHKSIIATTRNGRIVTILGQLDDQVHRIRSLAARTPGRLAATIDEHEAIVRALGARSPVAAEESMASHLAAARANAIAVTAAMPLSRSVTR